MEHLLNDSINLSSLQYLIIDEADRLLNQSFQNWSNVLLDKIDSQINIAEVWKLSVQNWCFRHINNRCRKLSSLKFYNPRLIIVNDSKQLVNEIFTVPVTLSEFKIHLGVAKEFIETINFNQILISTNKLSNVPYSPNLTNHQSD